MKVLRKHLLLKILPLLLLIIVFSGIVHGQTNYQQEPITNSDAATRVLVSVTSDGSQGNGNSHSPSISGDFHYVAYDLYASNLISEDNNQKEDIFVRDLGKTPTNTPTPTYAPTPSSMQIFTPSTTLMPTPTLTPEPSPTFADVPLDHWAYDFIEAIYQAGITAGCNTEPLMYCPDATVTRAEMAVFLENGIHYPDWYSPPDVYPSFGDTAGHWAEDWIEALYSDGITAGCSADPLLYCPDSGTTRAQMAVFLLKSKHGGDYTPPDVEPSFNDTAGHWAEDWIEQLAAEGITAGCGNGNYCPESPVTRAQMAVFLTRTFDLPMP